MEKQNRSFELPAVAFLMPGGKEAIAAMAIMPMLEEGGRDFLSAIPGVIHGTREALMHPLRAAIARRVNRPLIERIEAAIGDDIDVCPTRVGHMMVEIEKHRWIEAEKAKRDLWSEMSPQDPHAAAVRDWYRKHYKGWAACAG